MECDAGSFPDEGGIFCQCVGSVPIENREEFGYFLTCSGDYG